VKPVVIFELYLRCKQLTIKFMQKMNISCSFASVNIYVVAYLLKARTVEPEKQPLLGNCCVTRNNRVNIGSGVFCAVCAEAI
jgi:hypothetical protein